MKRRAKNKNTETFCTNCRNRKIIKVPIEFEKSTDVECKCGCKYTHNFPDYLWN